MLKRLGLSLVDVAVILASIIIVLMITAPRFW